MLCAKLRATLAIETTPLTMSPELLRAGGGGASLGGAERLTEEPITEGGAREVWLLTSEATLVMDLEEIVDFMSYSLSSEWLGRKTVSIEFPSKSMTAAE
jgi:hypothetical protein